VAGNTSSGTFEMTGLDVCFVPETDAHIAIPAGRFLLLSQMSTRANTNIQVSGIKYANRWYKPKFSPVVMAPTVGIIIKICPRSTVAENHPNQTICNSRFEINGHIAGAIRNVSSTTNPDKPCAI